MSEEKAPEMEAPPEAIDNSGLDAALKAWEADEPAEEADAEGEGISSSDEGETEAEVEAQGDEPEAQDEPKGETVQEEVAEEPTSSKVADAEKLSILARKERRMRKEHEERMGELKKYEGQLRESAKQVEGLQRAMSLAKTNLPAFLEAIGVSKESYAEHAAQLYNTQLGEEAPPEFRATRAAQQVQMELEQLRQEREAFQQQLAEERNIRQQEQGLKEYTDNLKGYLGKVPEKLRFVRAYAEEDNSGLVNEMLKVADRVARETQEVPSFDELAEAMEASLKETFEQQQGLYKKLLGSSEEKNSAKSGGRKSLSEKKVSARKTKPKANDPINDDDLINEAVKAWEEASSQGA